MTSLVYIHGFLSSPLSHKALQVKAWLAAKRPDIHYHCPALSAYPDEVQASLEALIASLGDQAIYLMGSSMGGFWSTWLAETYDLPAILINPAVKPTALMPKYLGLELQNYHTEDRYTLGEKDIEALLKLEQVKPESAENYWLLVQTGDETLDYQLAVDYYSRSRQQVEQGGDHGFQDFERFIPDSIEFCEDFYRNKR